MKWMIETWKYKVSIILKKKKSFWYFNHITKFHPTCCEIDIIHAECKNKFLIFYLHDEKLLWVDEMNDWKYNLFNNFEKKNLFNSLTI